MSNICWQKRASMTHGNSEGEGNLDLDWMSSESFTKVAY